MLSNLTEAGLVVLIIKKYLVNIPQIHTDNVIVKCIQFKSTDADFSIYKISFTVIQVKLNVS